jgi:hypothetical protein
MTWEVREGWGGKDCLLLTIKIFNKRRIENDKTIFELDLDEIHRGMKFRN